MKAGVKINDDSKVRTSLRIALYIILVLELSFSGITLSNYSDNHNLSIVNAESSVNLFDIVDPNEKSTNSSVIKYSLSILLDPYYKLVNEGPFLNDFLNSLHSRSPPMV